MDDPVASFDCANYYYSCLSYLMADRQGSIVGLANSSGDVTDKNAYDEYGVPLSPTSASPMVGRFGYTGQAWIPELGLWHYKARFYSPTLGRFMQTDPIGYEDQVNLYAYVYNDPVNNDDPTGMCGPATPWCVQGARQAVVSGVRACASNAACRTGVTRAATRAKKLGDDALRATRAAASAIGDFVTGGSSADESSSVDPAGGQASESRHNRGGQDKGERRRAAKPEGTPDPDKHKRPDENYRIDPHTGKKIPIPKRQTSEKPPEPERVPRGRRKRDLDW